MCAKVNVLPNAGGLFQQDPAHVRRLEIVYETQALIQNEENDAKAEARQRLRGR